MTSAAPLLRTLAERLDPRRTALLVIDMQNDFCAEAGYVERVVGKNVGACRAVVAPVNDLIDLSRSHGVPVWWIAADYDPAVIAAPLRAKQLDKGAAAVCAAGSWGAAFYGVSPAPHEPVVRKRSYSAFIGSDLAERLRATGRDVLVFAGVQTNVCVENSLRDAFCHGFYCIVASDCVASHSPALHEATLANVRFLYGDVATRAEIAAGWTMAAALPRERVS